MSKLFGGRWKTLDGPPLGQGGQSQVYRAIDTTGEHQGEFALKRVLNPERHDRFRNEVEAIKKLSHPNIIKLIDHSALAEGGTAEEKQFLVMPIAKEGDLSRPERLSYYKGSMEAVLQVAKQAASGLAAAHAAGIIHRDIKPQNILFTGNGHEIWITDFGICLLRENPRSTEGNEIVGPRSFMAPELEDGGKLDVSPAADVYSLGKVIYFMFSGGVILPRERQHEAPYAAILESGERPRLLRALLDQMICPIERRIKDMNEVVRRLSAIESWEQDARLLPINPTGLAAIEKLQRKAQVVRRVTEENTAAREQEARTLGDIKNTFQAWLTAELQMAVAHISDGGVLTCTVGAVTIANNHDWRAAYAHNRIYRPIGGLELRLQQPDDLRQHFLQIRLCEDPGPVVTVTSGVVGHMVERLPEAVPVRDIQLALVPYYRQGHANQRPNAPSLMGFMTKPPSIGTNRGQIAPPQPGRGQRKSAVTYARAEGVTQSFHADMTIHTKFLASEWPANAEALRETLTEAISAFLDYIASGAQRISP